MTKKPTEKKPAAAKKAAASKTPAQPATKKNAAKKAAVKPVAVAAPEAKATKTAKPVASAPKAAADKPKKPKLVRDSFTMPDNEYALFAQVKKACVSAGFEIKKSELLRIGVGLLAQMDPKKLQAAQQALVPLKAGRPKKK